MPVSINGNLGITFPDGSLQVAAASPFGLRNRIINGDMGIDQRNNGSAVTLTNASFTYGVDRWAGTVSTSTSTVTTQRVAIGSNGFQYGLRILRSSGTFTGNATIIQEPESLNTNDLQGQSITISYWARKGSTSTPSTFYVQLISGTGTDQGITGANAGSWTGWASVGTGVQTLTTTLTQYSTTFTVPSNSTELAILFNIQGYSGTGSANDYIDITGVQLEIGTTATPFERRLYNQELANCQRYYERSNATYTTDANNRMIAFKVTKRATPTISVTTVGGATATVSGGAYTGTDAFRVIATSASDFTWIASIEL